MTPRSRLSIAVLEHHKYMFLRPAAVGSSPARSRLRCRFPDAATEGLQEPARRNQFSEFFCYFYIFLCLSLVIRPSIGREIYERRNVENRKKKYDAISD